MSTSALWSPAARIWYHFLVALGSASESGIADLAGLGIGDSVGGCRGGRTREAGGLAGALPLGPLLQYVHGILATAADDLGAAGEALALQALPGIGLALRVDPG